MIRTLKTLAALTLAGLALATPARADLTPQEQADVTRINDYLNGIENITGRFLQINPDGVLSQGAFYMARPGRARFDYDEEELIVVARGQRLLIKEGSFVTNQLPLDGTPLKVLLGRDVDLAEDAEIIGVDSRAGTITATIRDPEAPELGQVTLIFAAPEMELQRWIVTDAQGLRTTVSLSDVGYPERIDPGLFQLESESSVFRGRQD